MGNMLASILQYDTEFRGGPAQLHTSYQTGLAFRTFKVPIVTSVEAVCEIAVPL